MDLFMKMVRSWQLVFKRDLEAFLALPLEWAYHISPKKHLWHLLNFEVWRCGTFWRTAFKRWRCLFQRKRLLVFKRDLEVFLDLPLEWAYHISPKKHLWHLLNFEVWRCGAFWRTACKRWRCLFQSKRNFLHKFQNFVIFSF